LDTKYKLFFTTVTLFLSAVFSFNASAQCTALVVQDEICLNDAIVSVTVDPLMIAPYSVTLTDAFGNTVTDFTNNITENLNPASGIAAGTYAVTISDGNGFNCSVADSIVVNDLSLSVIGLNADPTCFGASDGDITFTAVNGGGGPYLFEWYDDNPLVGSSPIFSETVGSVGDMSASSILDSLEVGTYYAIVTTNTLCSQEITDSVGYVLDPEGDIDSVFIFWSQITNVDCFTESSGGVNIDVGGDAVPFTYKWFDVNGTFVSGNQDLSGQPAGTYSVLISNDNDCQEFQEFTITEPSDSLQLFEDVASRLNINCNGESTGQITVIATGGTEPYLFSINGGDAQASGIFTDLPAGTHDILVTDATGECTDVISVELVENSELSIFELSHQNILCAGNLGSFELLANGGVGPYLYGLGVPTEPSGFFSNLLAGDYTVNISDALGCTIDTTITITELLGIELNINQVEPASCFGVANGVIEVSAAGGVGGYAYTVDNFATSQPGGLFVNLSANQYTIQVQDANGCVGSVDAEVSEPTEIVLNDEVVVDVSCAGFADASVAIEPFGGTGIYQYSWTGPNGFTSLLQDINGLIAGGYFLDVIDSDGCVSSFEFNPVAPAPILTQAILDSVSCFNGFDGSLELTVFGGNSPYTIDWIGPNGFVGNGFSLNFLEAGTYTVDVTDQFDCPFLPFEYLIEQPAQIAVSEAVTIIECAGDSTGQLYLDVEGGNKPYSLNWQSNNGVVVSVGYDFSISSLQTGLYNFDITDVNNCLYTGDAEILQNDPISEIFDVVSETCGNDNGQITANVSGGVSPYTYLWSNGETTSQINDLAGGFPYFLTVTDDLGCMYETSVIVPAVGVPQIRDVQVQDAICFSTGTGSIIVDVEFGIPPFTYTWDLPNGSEVVELDSVLENVVAGSYGLAVMDAEGCVVTNTAPIVVNEPEELETSIEFVPTTFMLSCNGDLDGEIHFNTVGGTPFEGGFYWAFVNDPDFSEQLITNSLYGLSAGVYDIAIVDSNGCIENIQHEILEPAVLTAQAFTNSPLCHGEDNGNADIVISGGTADFSFANITPFSNFIQLSADSFRIYGLSEGVYYYDIVDENGCVSLNNSFYVSEPDLLEINSIYSTPESCVQWDGIATTEVVGGTSPYIYNWTYDEDGTLPVLLSDGLTPNPNNILSTVDFLTSGTYYSHIIDYNGCTTYDSVEVFELSSPNLSVVDVIHNDCFGDAQGQISVNTSGGNPLYQYSIDGGNNWYYNTVFTNLTAGLHTITVRDSLDCSDVITDIEVLEPSPVVATSSTIDVSCFGDTDGSATVNATGGTSLNGEYSFVWQLPNGTNLFPSNLSGLSQTVYNLAPGSYQVEVTDDNGCFTLHSPVVIGEPQLIGVSAEVTSSFNNQQISCFASEDGVLQAVGAGGTGLYTFDWYHLGELLSSSTTPSLSIIGGLGAGDYDVYISDENGCNTSTSVTIFSPTEVMVSFEDVIHIRCEGEGEGQATAVPFGGVSGFYNYIWTNSASDTISLTQQAQNLVMGEYFVTVSDVNECLASGSIVIDDSEVFKTLGPDTVSVNCFGIPDGIADLNPTGGWLPYSHLWSDPLGQITQEATGLAAGQWYVDIIYDANGCLIVDSVYVDGPESYVSIDDIIASDALCFDENSGTIDLTIVGGTAPYTYNWEGPDSYSSTQANLNNVSAGTYHVTITDALGCENYTFTTVGQPLTPVQIINVNTTNVQCYGEANGTAIIPNSSIVGGVTPYNTVDWQGENPNSLEAGVYNVTVEDSNGCEGSFTYEIFEPTALTAVITDVVDEDCTGEDATIIVDAQGGVAPYSYMYQNDFITQNSSSQNLQIDFDPINEGNDTLVMITVTDDNGCEFIIEDVEVHPAHIFNYNASITVCEGTPVDLNAAIPVNYQSYVWNVMGEYSSESTVQFDATVSTIVTVDVVTADGCTFSDEIAVNVNYPIVDAGIDNGIIVGESVTLEATTGTAVAWLTPDTILQSSVEVTPLRTTMYYAAILDESNMCVGVDSIRVFVGMNEGFSPNGDGFNDTWEVSYLNQFGDLKLEVFNRWGMLLWSSQSPMIANWDGTHNGKDMPVGTYYYVITFNSEDKDPLTGPVTIVR